MNLISVIAASRRRNTNPIPALSPALWLDASDAATLYDATTGGGPVAPDGTIARWEDKSGNGRHILQATSAARATRKTAIKNGLDVARTTSATLLSIANCPILSGKTDYTTFSVFSAASISNQPIIWWNGKAIGTDEFFELGDGGTTRYYFGRVFGGQYWFFGTGSAAIAAGSFYVMAIRRLPVTLGALYHNGNPQTPSGGSLIATATMPSDASYKIGGYPNAGRELSGDLCEHVVFNTAISDSDVIAVNRYLGSKWAITVA